MIAVKANRVAPLGRVRDNPRLAWGEYGARDLRMRQDVSARVGMIHSPDKCIEKVFLPPLLNGFTTARALITGRARI
jgi:hypothetical protein